VAVSSASPRPPVAASPGSGYRWTILALLFFATTINYVDRQVLGILAPTLQRDLGWSETDYGDIVSWFSVAYGFGMLGMGRVLDWTGPRLGFSIAVVFWSLAAMGHAFARSVAGFSIARLSLGLSEAGNFPASIKTVAAWFPKKERAFATGIFNAGTNVGVVVAPLVVPWVTLRWGWQWAFIATGLLGFLWLIAWLILYRDPEVHPKVSAAELAYIQSDPIETGASIAWWRLLGYRQTWAFVVGKAFTDPVWFFYLFWLPKFLDKNFGVQLSSLAAPLIVIYVLADVGSVGGGWMSSSLIKRGWSVNAGRKTALLMAAVAILPTAFTPSVNTMWGAVAIVSLAAASHQWWSCNLFTLVSDTFPQRAVGSVVGMGGFGGAVAGWAVQRSTGHLLEATGGDYTYIFYVCGIAYVLALGIIHLLIPKTAPAKL
jgi:ACS family hexuronate transporter-like MFS transporter